MATQTGKFVVFGYTGTDGIAPTGLTGKMLFQSHDFEHKADEEQIKSATGDLVTRIFYNPCRTATLEVIPSDATNVAGAIASKTALLALARTKLEITACTDAPELVNSTWFVTSAKASGSNTGAHKVTLTLEQHTNITADPA